MNEVQGKPKIQAVLYWKELYKGRDAACLLQVL